MSQTSIRPETDDPQPARSSATSSSTVSLENEALVWSLATTEAYQPAPIDINVGRAERLELPALRWNNYESLPASVKLTNTGDTVILSARWNGATPSLEGGPLGGRYLFSQLHFHWGQTALEGSEHTVDGYRLPLEMHVIHFAERYADQDEALTVPGGVLCLVYLFNLKSSPNRFLEPVVSGLGSTVLPESYTKLEPFPLIDLFHAFVDEYFLYWGCIRNGPQVSPMLWMLSRTVEPLDFHQLKQFNRLLDRRMRSHYNLQPSNVEGPAKGRRHLFHVNPRTPMAVGTLMIEPPAKFSHTRWVVDRQPVDWSSPDACRQYVAMVREYLARKQPDQEDIQVQCPENGSTTNSEY